MQLTRTKLARIRADLLALKSSPHGLKPDDLESIAKCLGRVRFARGKEPTYTSSLPTRPPLTIPHHRNRELKTGTARRIIEQLLEDVDEWTVVLARADHLEDDTNEDHQRH